MTTSTTPPKYKVYTERNIASMPYYDRLSDDEREAIKVVGEVLPFKTNNFVVDNLIDWDDVPNDPIYTLTFPQRGMLRPEHYAEVADCVLSNTKDPEHTKQVIDRIRWDLNPHPAGQVDGNIAKLEGDSLDGMQHKYQETVLFFPKQGQTCHAYCSFCFRWSQFVDMDYHKFAMKEVDLLIRYLREHPEVTDVLITGGDPMVMQAKNLAFYLESLIEADIPTLRNIRIGTKSLTYWPYRFTADRDHQEVLDLFSKVVQSGIHLSIMAHFNHYRELKTQPTRDAIRNIRQTGAQIRTQSPVMRNINDDPDVWATMWTEQVKQGCIPYYMFVSRDTGAQHYFNIPLVEAWNIYREAIRQVSGLARTVRGPSMSTHYGKVQVVGVTELNGERIMVLNMLQGRNPEWVGRPFFAEYDPKAVWLDDLEPAFGERWMFDADIDNLAVV